MKQRTFAAALAALIPLTAAGAAHADATFLPGLYETKVRYPDDGPEVETTRDCLTAAEAQRESLTQRLAAAVQDTACRYTQRSIGAGRFAIAGTCDNAGIRTSVRQTGTYTPTSMTLDMTTSMAMPGAGPVSVRTVMSSRRVAASCPAGSNAD